MAGARLWLGLACVIGVIWLIGVMGSSGHQGQATRLGRFIHTAFVERLNLTMRQGVSALIRRT